MRTRLAVATVVACLVGPVLVQPAAHSAVSAPARPPLHIDGRAAAGPSVVDGEVAVRLRSGVSGDAAASVARAGYSIVSTRSILGWVVLRTSDEPAHVREVLAAHGDVVSTEPVSLLQATGVVVPNDPAYPQWEKAYLGTSRFPLAWGTVRTSSSLTLAVLDTGVDASHPDLAGHVAVGYDEIAGHGGANTDPNGHGTLVAGIAAAAANNRVGGNGAAWGGRILPIRVLDRDGSGTNVQVSQGIVDATNAGARVINMSLGGSMSSEMLSDAVTYAVSKGVVVVAAAGNGARNQPIYPAAYSRVLAVSATDASGHFAYFSSSGPWVDVAAPGVNVFGPAPCQNGACGYATGTGTSVAAPLVAATAMLDRTRYPADSSSDTVARIEHHAQDRGAPGIDDEYGWGLLDAAAAVGAAPRQHFVGSPGRESAEPNDAPAQATPLTLNVARSATTAPEGDTDWYSFNVPATTTDNVQVVPWIGTEWAEMVPQIDLYNSDLTHIYSFANGHSALDLPMDLTPGRWYLKVSNQNSTTSGRTPYTVALKTGSAPGIPPLNSYRAFRCEAVGRVPNVAVDDVNRDGKLDVITADGAGPTPAMSNLVQVFSPSGNGPCRLLQQFRYRPTAIGAFSLAGMRLADIDGDGRRDLLLIGNGSVWAVLNHAGQFQAAVRLNTDAGAFVQDARIADMNRDGHPDLIVASNRGIDIYYRGPTPSVSHLTDDASLLIAVGDVTGDGRFDVVTDRMTIYAQTPTGEFVARPPLDFTSSTGRIDGLTVGDINGDGRKDIVSLRGGNVPNSALQIHLQRDDGTYATAVNYAVGENPSSPLIADVNDDGRADLVVGLGAGNEHVGVLFQQLASPAFGPETETPEGSYTNFAASNALAVADVTGDGRRDIVSATGDFGIDIFAAPQSTTVPLVDSIPRNLTRNVASDTTIRSVFARAVQPTSITSHTVSLRDLSTGEAITAARHIDGTRKVVSIVPQHRLRSGHTYGVTITSIRNDNGATNTVVDTFRFTIA